MNRVYKYVLLTMIFIGLTILLQFVFRVRLFITDLFILLPGQFLSILSWGAGDPSPETGVLWEGGHGLAALNLAGIITIYLGFPLLLLAAPAVWKRFKRAVPLPLDDDCQPLGDYPFATKSDSDLSDP